MIYADDPAATAAFYERHLGIGTRLEADGNRYGEVPDGASGNGAGGNGAGSDGEAGKGVHVGIYPSEEGHASRQRSVMINFRVRDLDAFVERLRSEGVEVDEVIDEGWGKFAHFADPEGNPIEIWQKSSEGSNDGGEEQ